MALQRCAFGWSGRGAFGFIPMRDQCPRRRGRPFGAVWHVSPYAHAGCVVVTSEDGGDASLSFQGPAEGGPTVMVAGRTQAGEDHLHGLVGDDGDGQVGLGPDGSAVVNGAPTRFGFGDRRTASMSVGAIWVRHRTAPFRPVRSVHRRYTPGWVAIDPCSGRRGKWTAAACCPDGSVSGAMS